MGKRITLNDLELFFGKRKCYEKKKRKKEIYTATFAFLYPAIAVMGFVSRHSHMPKQAHRWPLFDAVSRKDNEKGNFRPLLQHMSGSFLVVFAFFLEFGITLLGIFAAGTYQISRNNGDGPLLRHSLSWETNLIILSARCSIITFVGSSCVFVSQVKRGSLELLR